MLIDLTDKPDTTKVNYLDHLTFIRQSLHIAIFLECCYPGLQKESVCLDCRNLKYISCHRDYNRPLQNKDLYP